MKVLRFLADPALSSVLTNLPLLTQSLLPFWGYAKLYIIRAQRVAPDVISPSRDLTIEPFRALSPPATILDANPCNESSFLSIGPSFPFLNALSYLAWTHLPESLESAHSMLNLELGTLCLGTIRRNQFRFI